MISTAMVPKDPEPRDWQVDCSKLKKRATQLFKSREWADCTFRFENPNSAGGFAGILKAHKLILAMASPTFAAQFYRSEDKPDVVDVEDISMATFSKMLKYLYTDDIDLLNVQNAIDLYYAAKKYFLRYLQKECVTYLSEQLSPSNVCQVYEFSSFFEETSLQKKCLKLISDRTLEVLRGQGFIDAKLQTIQTLMSMDPLKINSEIDLFKSLLKYARKAKFLTEAGIDSHHDIAEDSQDSESSSDNSPLSTTEAEDADMDQAAKIQVLKKKLSLLKAEVKKVCKQRKDEVDLARKLLRSTVQKIRFLTLTPKEFAECENIETLLKKDEIIAISMNIASLDCSTEMPHGFTRSLLPRNQINKNVPTGIIKFTANNLWTTRKHTSNVFCARNIPWKARVELSLKRTKDNNHKQTLKIYIDCFLDALSWSCPAEYTIKTIAGPNTTPAAMLNIKDKHKFTDKEDSVTHSFVWHIQRGQDGSMVNDSVTFEVSVTPEEPTILNKTSLSECFVNKPTTSGSPSVLQVHNYAKEVSRR